MHTLLHVKVRDSKKLGRQTGVSRIYIAFLLYLQEFASSDGMNETFFHPFIGALNIHDIQERKKNWNNVKL